MVPQQFSASPSAEGIARCLQFLVEEAASINMAQSSAAIAHALLVIAQEGGLVEMMEAPAGLKAAHAPAFPRH